MARMKYNFSKTKQLTYLLNYSLKSRLATKYRKPLLCGFKLTSKCNLKCRHCPFWRQEYLPFLDYKHARAILDKLHKDGIRILIFEGGEPLIWEKIASIVEYAKSLFFEVGITTNGTIDMGKANPDTYFVSIDGLREEHGKIRGENFDMIIRNIEANKQNKKIIVNTCINSINYASIPGLVKFLEGKVYGITVQFFYPFPGVESLGLTLAQRGKILEKLISLKKSGHSLLNSYNCLQKMKDNNWECHDFLVASVDPDGTINYGCYLKNRIEDISCKGCGYAAHCEISLAYSYSLNAISTAKNIFWG